MIYYNGKMPIDKASLIAIIAGFLLTGGLLSSSIVGSVMYANFNVKTTKEIYNHTIELQNKYNDIISEYGTDDIRSLTIKTEIDAWNKMDDNNDKLKLLGHYNEYIGYTIWMAIGWTATFIALCGIIPWEIYFFNEL